MTQKEHIVNILREVFKTPKEIADIKGFLDAKADQILSYMPEKVEEKSSRKPQKDI